MLFLLLGRALLLLARLQLALVDLLILLVQQLAQILGDLRVKLHVIWPDHGCFLLDHLSQLDGELHRLVVQNGHQLADVFAKVALPAQAYQHIPGNHSKGIVW